MTDSSPALSLNCPLDSVPSHLRALIDPLRPDARSQFASVPSRPKADNSVTLMQNFIRALGVSDAERDAVQALPATAALIDYRMRAVTDPARYHVGAGLCTTESMQQEALAAVDHTCSLFYSMYDNMYSEFCAPLPMSEGVAS